MCTIAGYVALIRLYAIFGFFGQNIGQKHLKKGLKRLGLVWYDSVVILSNPKMSKTQKNYSNSPKSGSNFQLKMAKFGSF